MEEVVEGLTVVRWRYWTRTTHCYSPNADVCGNENEHENGCVFHQDCSMMMSYWKMMREQRMERMDCRRMASYCDNEDRAREQQDRKHQELDVRDQNRNVAEQRTFEQRRQLWQDSSAVDSTGRDDVMQHCHEAKDRRAEENSVEVVHQVLAFEVHRKAHVTVMDETKDCDDSSTMDRDEDSARTATGPMDGALVALYPTRIVASKTEQSEESYLGGKLQQSSFDHVQTSCDLPVSAPSSWPRRKALLEGKDVRKSLVSLHCDSTRRAVVPFDGHVNHVAGRYRSVHKNSATSIDRRLAAERCLEIYCRTLGEARRIRFLPARQRARFSHLVHMPSVQVHRHSSVPAAHWPNCRKYFHRR